MKHPRDMSPQEATRTLELIGDGLRGVEPLHEIFPGLKEAISAALTANGDYMDELIRATKFPFLRSREEVAAIRAARRLRQVSLS